MYVRIPIRGFINDTILNKPIVQDNTVVGIITHYDEKYIYGTLWVRTAIATDAASVSFAVVMEDTRDELKEEIDGYNISSR